MTITTNTTPTHTNAPIFWRPAALAAIAAAAATTTVAAIAHAAGVSLAIDGEQIPLVGFAQLTVMFSFIGILLAAALRRWASRPRVAFLRTTIVLTALSLIPDLLTSASASTKVTLMTTHLVAASIVIPVLVRLIGRRHD